MNQWLDGKLSETDFFDFEHRLLTDSTWRKEVFDLLPDTEAAKSGRLQSDATLKAMIAPLLDEFQEGGGDFGKNNEGLLYNATENATFQNFKEKAALWKEDLDNLPEFLQEPHRKPFSKNLWLILIDFIILIILLTFTMAPPYAPGFEPEKMPIPELHFIRESGNIAIRDSTIIQANLPTDLKHYQFRSIGALDWTSVCEPFRDSVYQFKVKINRNGDSKDSTFIAKPLLITPIAYKSESNYLLRGYYDPFAEGQILDSLPKISSRVYKDKSKSKLHKITKLIEQDTLNMTNEIMAYVSDEKGLQEANDYYIGKENYFNKNYNKSIDCLEKVDSSNNNYYKAQLMLSDIYRKQNDYKRSIRYFEKYAEVSEGANTKWRLLMLYLADYDNQTDKFKDQLDVMLKKGSPENKVRAKKLQVEMKRLGMLK